MNSTKVSKMPEIGDVYLINFSGIGNEQSGWRPGVIFQNNVGNKHSPNVIALPLTSSLKREDMPTHILIKAEDVGLKYDSLVLCENPQRASKERLGSYITSLPDDYMKQIAVANLISSSAIAYLDKDTLLDTWEKTVSLNSRG